MTVDAKTIISKKKLENRKSELEFVVGGCRFYSNHLRDEWLQHLLEIAHEIRLRARSGGVPSSRLRHLDRILHQMMVVTLMNATDMLKMQVENALEAMFDGGKVFKRGDTMAIYTDLLLLKFWRMKDKLCSEVEKYFQPKPAGNQE